MDKTMKKLCRIDEIDEGGARGYTIDEVAVLVVCKEQQFYVYANRCPHLGVQLEWQEHQFLNKDNTLIQCSTHGALFNIKDGLCISGPCNGSHLEAVASSVNGEFLYIKI